MASRRGEAFEYVYDSRVGTYRDIRTGQLVARALPTDVLETRMSETFDRLTAQFDAVLFGTADLQDWQQAMATDLRRLMVQATALGAGGMDQVTGDEWLALARDLKFHYRHLRDFARDVNEANMTEDQARNRMSMYASAAWASYWEAKNKAMERAGYTHERRIVDRGAESCDDCLEYERRDVVPIGTLPAPGKDSECLTKCRCIKVYGRIINGQFVEGRAA